MTIQECFDRVNEMKPSMMNDGKKMKYLDEIEGLIHTELLMKHEHTEEEAELPRYDEATDPGTELIVPDRYAMVYVYWLMTKIDLVNLEYEKYNADRTLFDNAYDMLSDWWTRTRMPISTEREFRL